jgi:hypothetical protein
MRELVGLCVLLSFACSSSTISKDSASSFDAGGPDSNLDLGTDLWAYTVIESIDAGVCGEIFQMGVPVNLGVDAGSCESRPTVPCNTGTLPMADLAEGCGGLPLETSFIVSFSQGCADYLYPSPTLSDHPIVACLANALNASHFACAEQYPCLGFANSTLY